MCMLLTSRREGYGLVVVEAAARGTPSIVVAGEDNAATELIEEGVNGFVAAGAEPAQIAEAIVRVHAAGGALRESTARWFTENAGGCRWSPRCGSCSTATQRGIAVERQPRGALPGERASRWATARARRRSRSARRSSSRRIAAAIAGSSRGVEQQRRVARHLRQRGGVRAGDGHAARHRLEHRQPEALVQRREHERPCDRPQALELRAGDPRREAHVVGDAERVRARSRSSRSCAVAIAGDHEHRTLLGR